MQNEAYAPPPVSLPPLARCARHPERPPAIACPHCRAFACEACIERGADGALRCASCRDGEGTEPLPWDQRHQLGTLTAFWRTSRQVMASASRTFERTPPEGSFRDSYLFALLSGVPGVLPTALLYTVVILLAALAGAEGAGGSAAVAAIMGSAIVMGFGMGILLAPLFGAGIDHLGLLMVGAKPRNFHITLRAWALAQGPMLLGLVPGCGLFAASLWTWVTRVQAYRALHRISTGRALAATVVPVALLLLLSIGLGVGVAVLAAAAADVP